MAEKTRLIDLRHPHHLCMYPRWKKWRSTYEGGDCFIDEYVKMFSHREDAEDFKRRKEITPCPSFAKAAVNDVKNSIFQRTAEVTRRGGSQSYQKAVTGQEGGVDLHGAAMNTFIGREILPELLTMAKVGVFVDMPPIEGPTLMDQQGKKPYLYKYRAESIVNWLYQPGCTEEFQALLLCDYLDCCCDDTHLPTGEQWQRFRYVWLQDGVVHVKFYNSNCELIDMNGSKLTAGMREEYILNIPRIPFVIFEISDSLLADIATAQIALVNLESSDVAYACLSNVPFYTEQASKMELLQSLQPIVDGEGTTAEAVSKVSEIKVGATQGRRYAPDMDRPGFIHPSSEPLMASMAKQKQLKDDIRQLINLALSNIKPKMASAESKAIDERGLESGLSYIGLELEHGERKIAEIWSLYEGGDEVATVMYPKQYSLESDEDRRKNAEQLEQLRDSVPSMTFQRTVSKEIATTLLGTKVSTEELDKIHTEIEASPSVIADHEIIFRAVEAGVLDPEGAEKILGLPPGSADKAADAHAERAARIAKAQADVANQRAAARGVADMSADPAREGEEEKAESRDNTLRADVRSRVRGEGK